MTALVRSTHAVFDEATGDLLFCAPQSLVPSGAASVAMPEDFADWSHVWSASERRFVVDLVALKAAASERVKVLRERAKDGGVVTPFGPIQTDPDSRTNINGAVQMATILGAAFSVEWRMADDNLVVLDAAAMVNLGLLIGQHVSACQYRKNELDAAIAAAATAAELDAIDLEAGWPGS